MGEPKRYGWKYQLIEQKTGKAMLWLNPLHPKEKMKKEEKSSPQRH
jgi:hypothetical protein